MGSNNMRAWKYGIIVALLALVETAQGQMDAQSTTGPTPPPEVLMQMAAGELGGLPEAAAAAATLEDITPRYLWRHGCGPTALGMVVGYYDRLGWTDLIPGDAATQTTQVNQVIASGGTVGSPWPAGQEQHLEDYGLPQDDGGALMTDAVITAGRTPHDDNSLADFMLTSRSTVDNKYGWSWFTDVGPAFVDYVNLINPAYNATSESYYTYNGSLTWEVLTTEIDAGRPMVFLVDSNGDGSTDHFVTVIGYNDGPPQQYYCYTTWDSPATAWCNFAPMASGRVWGVYGGWSLNLDSSPTTGTITVTLSPEDVLTEARWRLTSSPDTSWKSSGESIGDITPGTYTLEFSDVDGWTAPSSREVEIFTGINTETGVYTSTAIIIQFRQGNWTVNGESQGTYNGVSDITIEHPFFTGNPADRLYVWRYNSPYNEVNNSLLRFQDIHTYVNTALTSLSAETAELTEAEVKLTYRHDAPAYQAATIDMYECLQDWTDAATWTKYDGVTSWDTDGAKGVNDRGDMLASVYMGPRSTSVQYYDGQPFKFSLDIAKVQNWLDVPSTNQGLLYTMAPGLNTYVAFASSEDSTENYRPLLTLVFTLPTPPSHVEVPDVMGLIRADAEKLLAQAGLSAAFDTPYGDTAALDFVMEQTPAPGEMTPGGSAVTLTVVTCDFTDDQRVNLEDFAALAGDWMVCNAATPTNLDLSENNCVDLEDLLWFIPWFTQDVETITVPGVVGQTQAAALTSLSQAGLGANIILLPSSTIPAGNSIYKQAPQAGSEAPLGGTVDIYFSLGAAPGDFDDSEFVDAADLALLAGEWLTSGATLTADMDNSGTVDLGDFAIFSNYWLMDYMIPE